MYCKSCKDTVIVPNGESNVISSHNIAVKIDDYYLCNACNEAMMLFAPDTKPEKKKVEIEKPKVKTISKSLFVCVKCKTGYEGNKCTKCNTPNPMFMRKSRKTKSKKKKK